MKKGPVQDGHGGAAGDRLTEAFDLTIECLSRVLDFRNRETEGHTQRVTELTLKTAGAMDMSAGELVHLRRGAMLHDVGKLGIPDDILFNPRTVTDQEWVIIRQHPVIAFETFASVDYLRPALDIPYCHHEKWNGTGYPRGLVGEDIPLAARIFTVVDVWDALRSARPYRPAWGERKVLDYLRKQSGKLFDPQVVEIFLRFQGTGD